MLTGFSSVCSWCDVDYKRHWQMASNGTALGATRHPPTDEQDGGGGGGGAAR